MRRAFLSFTLVALLPGAAHAVGTGVPVAPPPLVVAGGRVVDVRDTNGGISRFTTIPSTSAFRTYAGRNAKCEFASPFGGIASNGAVYAPYQLVRSSKWIFLEGLPAAIGEPNPTDPHVVKGSLATAVRHFTVFCDSLANGIAIIDVSARDPMLDPRTQLTNLFNGLRLTRPVVFRNPVVDRWGGLITRYQAWLAITPSAWRGRRSNAATWRGWTMYLLTTPAALEFQVDFTPDPTRASRPFHGVVGCIALGAPANGGSASVPAMPTLPIQSAPGVNGPCRWTPPGPGSVTIQARVIYHVTFWANGYTEVLADYVWTSAPTTFRTGELAAVNTNA